MSGMVLAIASLGIMVGTALLWLPDSEQRTNFLYLSTPTRASGLLLGAALAFVWKPWTSAQDVRRLRSIAADAAAIVAIGVIAYAMATQHVDDRATEHLVGGACHAQSRAGRNRTSVIWLVSLALADFCDCRGPPIGDAIGGGTHADRRYQ
jgi:hypothetical protein